MWDSSTLSEEHREYLYSRGGSDQVISEIGFFSWQASQEVDLPGWAQKFGPKGEFLEGMLIWPWISPRGRTIGLAGRRIANKQIAKYQLPEAEWNPVWAGMTTPKMEKIWQGADVWVVEGMFDLLPLCKLAVSKNAVVLASERAHLTDRHLKFLKRYARGRVFVIYDNDEAGRRGSVGDVKSKGAVAKLCQLGVKCLPVRYSGKDPGVVWDNGGYEGIEAAFGHL